jgi:hypothetical protein
VLDDIHAAPNGLWVRLDELISGGPTGARSAFRDRRGASPFTTRRVRADDDRRASRAAVPEIYQDGDITTPRRCSAAKILDDANDKPPSFSEWQMSRLGRTNWWHYFILPDALESFSL